MRNFGVILASHGKFAVEALNSIQMIAGKQEGAIALELDEHKSLHQLKTELHEAYALLKQVYGEVLVLCDVYGGTPFNSISACILEGIEVIAYTGLNLPMLLEVFTKDELTKEEISQTVEEAHQYSLTRIDQLVMNDADDCNDL